VPRGIARPEKSPESSSKGKGPKRGAINRGRKTSLDTHLETVLSVVRIYRAEGGLITHLSDARGKTAEPIV